MLSGIAVTVTKQYRAQLWMGWIIVIIGLALLGSTHAGTSLAAVIGFEILTGAGFGVVFATTYFPILAPLPLTSVAQALSFFAFLRQFTQVRIYRNNIYVGFIIEKYSDFGNFGWGSYTSKPTR